MSDKDLDNPEVIKEMRLELDFNELKKEIIKELDENKEIVLSTSLENRVTSRIVSYANDMLYVYFLSWEHNKKIHQIKGNPNIALSLNRIQIEGKAKILSNVTENDNEHIKTIFRKKISDRAINTFFSVPEMVIVKITPKSIIKFCNIDKRFHFQVMDLAEEKASQMRLEDKTHLMFPY